MGGFMKRVLQLLLVLISCIVLLSSCWLFGTTEISHNVTPTLYKIAVINLELLYSSSTLSTNIYNESPETAKTTILDILPGTGAGTNEETFSEAVNNAAIAGGETYDGYILEPLYIEMELSAAFHFDATCTENGYDLDFTMDGDEDDYLFRFYFNPVDNLWKRDILVYLDELQIHDPALAAYPSGWYWMRRGIESGGASNFLILAMADGVVYDDTNLDPADDYPDHPDSTSGSTSVIDLFSNNAFWGAEADYDNYSASTATTIDSTNDTGGMKINWGNFTFTAGDTVTINSSVNETFNFWYESDTAKTDFTDPSDPDVIDFGPSTYDPASPGVNVDLGDWGFHPFMPDFTAVSTAP